MKLDCVLTAVNENPLYIDFIPFFIKSWNKLYPSVDVKIVLIANDIPQHLLSFKNNIILFKPIQNMSTAFISQYIRLLYPCIMNEYNNGIMITDIDIIPMNKYYYIDNIKNIDDNKFVYFRENICFEYTEIAMCYNIGLSSTWSDIFKINSIDDIQKRLISVCNNINYIEGHGKSGWSTDQRDLYKYIMQWNNITNNFICLKENETKFKRLDRFTFQINDNIIKNNISNGIYTDYHCLRPMSKYNDINNQIYELLPN